MDRFYDTVANGKGKFAYAVSYNTETNGTLTYNYDQINNYDKLGRVTSKSQNFLINQGGYTWQPYTTTATYNLAGMMTSETYPSGRTVYYNYDDAGRTTSFTGYLGDSAFRNYSTQMSYLPGGQLTKEVFGTTTPLYQRLNYNSRQQLFAVRVGTYNGTTYDNDPQAAQSSQTSSWDRGMLTWRYGSDDATIWGAGGANNNGNVVYAQHWIPGANSYNDEYEYDNLNRLKQITENGNASFVQAFDYDQWGNRTINQTLTTTSADVNKKIFTVNTTNNRLGVPSGQPSNIKMEYDGVGNLVNDTWTNPNAGGAMEYDAENHMTSAVNGAHKYRYNADGKRVRRIISGTGEFWMVYGIGGELVAEYNASTVIPTQTNPTKEYGYRNGQLLVVAEGSNPQWLIQDHLGSTRIEICLSGASNTVVRRDYFPFGEEIKGSLRSSSYGYGIASCGSGPKQKFTGYERDDETGLDFAQARYYANVQGRFTSVDPLLASGIEDEPQSWNRYNYCLNNPLRFTDPTGLIWGKKDGEYVWYNSEDELKNAGAEIVEFAHGFRFYYEAAGGGWIRLDPNRNSWERFDTEEQAFYNSHAPNAGGQSALGGQGQTLELLFGAQGIGSLATSLVRSAALRFTTVEVFRVEALAGANTRVLISEAGNVGVQGEKMLFLNFGVKSRAEDFLAKRLAQGFEDTVIKSFRVKKSFLNELRSSAVLESEAAAFPGRPLLVDTTKAVNQFGLRSAQIQALQKATVQGSGKIK